MDSITSAENRYMQEHINDDKQPLLIAVSITTLIVAYIAVFLRFFTRKRWGVLLAADDWWILTALVGVHVFQQNRQLWWEDSAKRQKLTWTASIAYRDWL